MDKTFLKLKRFPTLETDRLILRELEEHDFPDFHALISDAKVNEHIQMDWADPKEARKWFDSFKSRFKEGQGIRWAIQIKDGPCVGNFGFRDPRPEIGCIERGLQIASPHWRHGYGREASQKATEWLLKETPYRKVDAWIATGNLPAIKLVEKQGFHGTGETKLFCGLTLLRFLYPKE